MIESEIKLIEISLILRLNYVYGELVIRFIYYKISV